jgi:hypothetical protein
LAKVNYIRIAKTHFCKYDLLTASLNNEPSQWKEIFQLYATASQAAEEQLL